MDACFRIAIADDDRANLDFLRATLGELGHEVVSVAENGKQLVKHCRAECPDLILTGIKMPKLDGIGASMEICRERPLPVILVSAHHNTQLIERALADHVFAYLVKPIKRADLETAIALVVRRFGEMQALQRQAHELRQALDRVERLQAVQASAVRLENVATSASRTRDESDRGDGNKSVKTSEQRHRTLLQTIPHGVQEIDAEGVITFANAAHCRMHGYVEGELTGKAIWNLLATDAERNVLREQLATRVASQPPPTSYATRHRRKDGTIIDVQVDWTYQRDEQGQVAGFIAIITDITARKQTEVALRIAHAELQTTAEAHSAQLADADEQLQEQISHRQRAEEALRRAERLASIGILAAGIAHEINNPVVAALNSAETALAVKDRSDSGGMVEECLKNIVDSATRCGEIVTDVLKFARHESTEKRRHCLNAVVGRAVDFSRGAIGQSGATVTLHLDESPLFVYINPLEIEVLVTNLLRNAVEAAIDEKPGRIVVRTARMAEVARISVEDDGRGIADDEKTHIFDPFYTTRRQAGGTGLGLSIVYRIVQAHGGTIDVQSEPSRGTTITVELPLAENVSQD